MDFGAVLALFGCVTPTHLPAASFEWVSEQKKALQHVLASVQAVLLREPYPADPVEPEMAVADAWSL